MGKEKIDDGSLAERGKTKGKLAGMNPLGARNSYLYPAFIQMFHFLFSSFVYLEILR